MSKISLSPSPTGSAVYTIASPAGSTDRTLTLPDAAGTVFVGGQALSATTGSFSGNVTLGSSVLATPTGSAPAYLCRAWVNFNGTGTPAIQGSGNVSSVTLLATGRYRVNFSTAMPDTNYAVTMGARAPIGYYAWLGQENNALPSKQTSSIDVTGHGHDNSISSVSEGYVAIFR